MIEASDRIKHIQTYYFARKLAEIRKMNANGEAVLNLGIGNPDLRPPDEVIDSLKNSLDLDDTHKYQAYIGIPELRGAFADYYNRWFQLQLNPESEILPLMGSKEGIMHISMAYLNPGDKVLIPNPSYPSYETISKICGAEAIPYKIEAKHDYQIQIDALEDQKLDRVKLMWVNSPHMPTGSKLNPNCMEALIDFGKRNNILICHDNPYTFILNDKPASLLQFDKTLETSLELNSMSKHYNMAGWRVGSIVGSSEVIKNVLRFKSNMDSGMFKSIQLAAVEALKAPASWFENLNQIYKERRELVYTLLDHFECTYSKDQSGLFIWAKVSEKWKNGEALSDHVLSNFKVFITPGFIFGTEGDSYVRISLCQDVIILNQALERCK